MCAVSKLALGFGAKTTVKSENILVQFIIQISNTYSWIWQRKPIRGYIKSFSCVTSPHYSRFPLMNLTANLHKDSTKWSTWRLFQSPTSSSFSVLVSNFVVGNERFLSSEQREHHMMAVHAIKWILTHPQVKSCIKRKFRTQIPHIHARAYHI